MIFGWSNEDEIAANFNLLASANTINNCQQVRANGCEMQCQTDSQETGMAFINLKKNDASITAQFAAGTVVLRFQLNHLETDPSKI